MKRRVQDPIAAAVELAEPKRPAPAKSRSGARKRKDRGRRAALAKCGLLLSDERPCGLVLTARRGVLSCPAHGSRIG